MELHTPLVSIHRCTEQQKKGLAKLRLETVADLLYYFPTRYTDFSSIKSIQHLHDGEVASIFGVITKIGTKKSFRGGVPMAEALIEDMHKDTVKVVWFNQAFLGKTLKKGTTVKVSGKVTIHPNYGVSMQNPEIEKGVVLPSDFSDSLFHQETTTITQFPIYKESKGVTSRFLYHLIKKISASGIIHTIPDPIPETILQKYALPKITQALFYIHLPKKQDDAAAARKRFAFEEIFTLQVKRQQDKAFYAQEQSYPIIITPKDIDDFTARFPFTQTTAQKNTIETIVADMQRNHPMARLIEGDVGSGKTAIAATAAYGVMINRPRQQTYGNLQVAYMAPTEILATQHFLSFIEYFKHTGISIGLLTGSGCKKFPSKVASNIKGWTDISRAQLLKWVANGEIPILIGTHALIQKSVKFKDLALVIVDEQHRFGARQRAALAKKEGFAPHFLSMTATPIPRTLALTLYGDLDISLLDELPKGRKPVQTQIIEEHDRGIMYQAITKELQSGRQVYVICPRIDAPDEETAHTLRVRSVTEEAKRLQKDIFPQYVVGMLHGKMSTQKKEAVMHAFSAGKIHILVATSVVEVGVNVPNATVMIIEGGERFGLAQLHQLRGRIVRSSDQAYCYVLYQGGTEKTQERLQALITAKNGFELAELDLSLRGAGELSGDSQWGVTDIGMEAIKNIKMVEAARTEAVHLITEDATLQAYPLLQKKIEEKTMVHFE